jgi:hypothetical protein
MKSALSTSHPGLSPKCHQNALKQANLTPKTSAFAIERQASAKK